MEEQDIDSPHRQQSKTDQDKRIEKVIKGEVAGDHGHLLPLIAANENSCSFHPVEGSHHASL